MDIVELLENLNVEWHQEPIINLAADEIERLREALREIRFRIDNMPNDMSLTPNSAIFDLIRHRTIMALGEKE
jgi:hypothetical protein